MQNSQEFNISNKLLEQPIGAGSSKESKSSIERMVREEMNRDQEE